MADEKLSALTEVSAPTADARVYVVNDVAGTPTSGYVDLANLRLNVLPWSKAGTLVAETGASRLVLPFDATLVSVRAAAGTAPTGAAIIVDVNIDGTTAFTTQGDRPTIGAGTNASAAETPAVTALPAGSYLTVDIDQIGSTVAGADLTVTIEYTID